MLPLGVGRACPSTRREPAGHHMLEPGKTWAPALARGREEAREDTQICSLILEHWRDVKRSERSSRGWDGRAFSREQVKEAGGWETPTEIHPGLNVWAEVACSWKF